MVVSLVAVSQGQGSKRPGLRAKFSRQDSARPFQAGGRAQRPPATLACSWLSWRHELPTPQA